MLFNKLASYFLPDEIRNDEFHPRYHKFRVVVSSVLISLPIVLLFPVFVYFMDMSVMGYFINATLLVILLLSIKFFGHYRIPMTITALVTYFLIYDWIKHTGLIYSPNISILHMYLLAAIWVDKKYGWLTIFSNLIVFGFIFSETQHAGLATTIPATLSGPLYALGMNCLITLFFGSFLAYQQLDQEQDRAKIRNLQDQKISLLDEAVKKRTEQLHTMRENIATDFHDETGNMLSAITRQASLLRLKLDDGHELQPIVESILKNSKALYAGSKDFLWHLNHDSDDPKALFEYLTSYGQHYYNQFDIAFSSVANGNRVQQLDPSAALHIILIFKEAMTNVVKHADATEVVLAMTALPKHVSYSLRDNGHWKAIDDSHGHYGMANMRRRCEKNGFDCEVIHHTPNGTELKILIPVMIHQNA